MKDNDDLIGWLGYRQLPDWREARWLGSFFGFLLLLGFILLVMAAFVTLAQFVAAVTGLAEPGAGSTRHEAIRNIGLVLAALVGAPFVVWRAWVADRQMRLQGESLFNEMIETSVVMSSRRTFPTKALRTRAEPSQAEEAGQDRDQQRETGR